MLKEINETIKLVNNSCNSQIVKMSDEQFFIGTAGSKPRVSKLTCGSQVVQKV